MYKAKSLEEAEVVGMTALLSSGVFEYKDLYKVYKYGKAISKDNRGNELYSLSQISVLNKEVVDEILCSKVKITEKILDEKTFFGYCRILQGDFLGMYSIYNFYKEMQTFPEEDRISELDSIYSQLMIQLLGFKKILRNYEVYTLLHKVEKGHHKWRYAEYMFDIAENEENVHEWEIIPPLNGDGIRAVIHSCKTGEAINFYER